MTQEATPIAVDTRAARCDPRCGSYPIKEDAVSTKTELHHRGKLLDIWRRWRESRRQYQLERAVYKASGGMEQFEHHHDGDLSQIPTTPGVNTGAGTSTGGM